MPDRFKKDFTFLVDKFQNGKHILPPGSSPFKIKETERRLKFRFSQEYRQFMLLTDGAKIFKRIRFWRVSDLFVRNQKMHGGWFDENNLFFAETEYPDYFYFNINKSAVNYFNGEPCEIGEAAPSFTAWLQLICKQKGFGGPSKLYKT